MAIRVFLILSLLLMSSSILQVARCEPDPDAGVVESAEEGDLGIIGEDAQDFAGGSFGPAPGVETVCVFPRNPSKLVAAGEESELLVGMKNEAGDSSINVIAIHASVHLSYDPSYLLQNLSAQIMTTGQRVTFEYHGIGYIFTINQAAVEGLEKSNSIERGMISADTYIIFEAPNSSGIKIVNQREAAGSNIFKHKEFNLQSLGIGGLS